MQRSKWSTTVADEWLHTMHRCEIVPVDMGAFMTNTLEWVEHDKDHSLIEINSDAYDYVITYRDNKKHVTLRRYLPDSDVMLDAIPCFSLEIAKQTAQRMENIATRRFGGKPKAK